MILTEKQLFDFMHCPTYYDCVYNRKLPVEPKNSLNNLLNRVASSFYLNLMNGRVLPLSTLKNKWDSVCEKNKDVITSSKVLEGITLLSKMYLWAADQELRIFDIKTPYAFVIKTKEGVVEYRGEMGTVAYNKNEQYEFLVTNFSNRFPDQSILDMKLKYTLDAYAFQKMYKRKIGIHIHHVGKDKDFFAMRSHNDFERMEKTIANIALSIKHDLYYPREQVLCSSCVIKDICKIWN